MSARQPWPFPAKDFQHPKPGKPPFNPDNHEDAPL